MPTFSIPIAGFVHHYLVLAFSSTCFNTILLCCDSFLTNLKSDTDTGYGYLPHKAHMQNDLNAYFTMGEIWSTHKNNDYVYILH